jgi:hypothetical protein
MFRGAPAPAPKLEGTAFFLFLLRLRLRAWMRGFDVCFFACARERDALVIPTLPHSSVTR